MIKNASDNTKEHETNAIAVLSRSKHIDTKVVK